MQDLSKDERRQKAHDLLDDLRAALWDQHGVDAEFYRAEFDDLIKLTSLTKTGRLTKAARTALEARVRDDKERQDRSLQQREADRQRRLEDAARAEHATPQEQAAEPGEVDDQGAPWDSEAAERHSGPVKPDTDGRVEWAVVATFMIRVAPTVTSDAIRAEARRVLEAAGIKTLKNVSAQRKQGRAA